MSDEAFHIQPHVFKTKSPSIRVSLYHESNLKKAIVNAFLGTIVDGAIGVAPSYGSRCVLRTIAFSSPSQVLLIRLSSSTAPRKSRKGQKNKATIDRSLLEDILCRLDCTKYTFKMDKFSTSLHLDLGLHITNGVDLLSVAKGERHSVAALMSALGGELTLNKAEVSTLFKDNEIDSDIRATAAQAWVACRAGLLQYMSQQLANLLRINTKNMHPENIAILAKTVRDADRLVALKPTKVKNEVEAKFSHKQGNVMLVSTRFKTRIMHSAVEQRIEIETAADGKRSTAIGWATHVNGRSATVSLKNAFHGSRILSVTTFGREALTNAESMRNDVVMEALQGANGIMRSPFVRRIWFPSEIASWAGVPSSPLPVSLYFPGTRKLNPSQERAVNVILSHHDADRVALIHGPPGTGKTTVIAAAVTSVMASRNQSSTLWVVAQANVAVKNIAEKLADIDFLDFKLLVSKDFHFDWHEHLYEKVVSNVIRTDDFVDSITSIERLLLGSRVVLCTLSMLSHPNLSPFMRLVPPQTLIFDEASQIEIGGYFPLLHRFQHTLSKLVFIGDDKQLAPYGQGDINDLRSIFEMPHLRKSAIFLDTQYRMPVPIGQFISRHVYNHQLKTIHSITTAKSCIFVDVANGKEAKKGSSWMNQREIQVAMSLAKKYHNLRKRYRIITPYDAQRSLLETELQGERLPWEDRCFNVDSFQGNEEDFIIISIVRSEKIGFLKENRRVNVMLTRCKKGMIILTSRAFVEGKASSSLVGSLAKALGPQAWVESKRVLYGNFKPSC